MSYLSISSSQMKQKVLKYDNFNVIATMRKIVTDVIDQTTKQHDVINVIDDKTKQQSSKVMNVINVIDQTTNHKDDIYVIDQIKPNNENLINEIKQTIADVIQNVINVIDKQQNGTVMNDNDGRVIKPNVINDIDQTTKQQAVNDDLDDIDRTTEQHSKVANSRGTNTTSKLMNNCDAKMSDVPKQFLDFESCPQPSRPSLNLRGGTKTTQNNSRATPKHENQAHDPNNKQNSEFGVT